MLQHFDESRSHLVIPLLGKFKGEDHSSQHLMPCVHVTDSGIQVKTWMLRVMAVHQKLGRREGPMFIDSRGSQATAKFTEYSVTCYCAKRDYDLVRITLEFPHLFGF